MNRLSSTHARAALFLTVFSFSSLVSVPLDAHAADDFEGYGAVTRGAFDHPDGYETYHVTSLADSGPGTLRDAVNQENGTGRLVVFDVAGTITLQQDIVVRGRYVTIDGSTAPSPGITIRKKSIVDGEFIIAGTHDVVITDLRFWGLWEAGGTNSNNAATITIDADTRPDYAAKRIILDHLTVRGSTDGGPDVWGNVSDVTISWCLIYESWHPTILSHYPAPFETRQRISMHHNVYARNNERNPQLRADVRNLDYVNNIIYDWGYFAGTGTGIRIKNDADEPQVNGNFINNAFLATRSPQNALIYGVNAGRDSEDGGPTTVQPQGTLVTNSDMGDLYVAGNILPPENKDHYSTIGAPLPVPSAARVTTVAASRLGEVVLPEVGMLYPSNHELDLLDEIAAEFDATGTGEAPCWGCCISGPGSPSADPDCLNADMDVDGDVDLQDFSAS